MTTAEVWLWGSRIGAVTLPTGERFASFEYDPAFQRSGIGLSPLNMPLGGVVYRFPALPTQSFHGLPGMLADALPDKYGNALIDAWLATQGRTSTDFNAVERLCYTGTRGMGALEFRPVQGPTSTKADSVEIEDLVKLASEVLVHRKDLRVTFASDEKAEALREILRVGTSAGGARAKAIIAWNADTNEVRSGQVQAPEGFGYWLMKFDGVANNKDHELADPQGFGAIEFAYSRMAAAAGIEMAECRLFDEGGRRHFMTRRFDRQANGDKLHMQSLAALAHLDFNEPRANTYEQAFTTIRALGLGQDALDQQFRRAVFNIVGRNQDDHVKNIAFLMDPAGNWRLAPAFDIAYAYNPGGDWTSQHQMSLAGQRDNFTLDSLIAGGKSAGVSARAVRTVLGEVTEAIAQWRVIATDVGVPPGFVDDVEAHFRLDLR
ncbi:type II toxin-antitoxin system HipA family toxin [Rhizorhabdus dicambivorans]|uniref:Type II toxin-antitoxin system HipA family toxin n=1 Tax=Rhizorhabdus dicambivorans TaxID=1850238 RepID=A0A2A4FU92_9SPHN|nr:HipA domain-containing protein [Rhizorhabdus dicambivorans]ATE66065.1 type II toxin-antitoxin system HipA family toxin [Rhizorhabdus dicambivorans]PCE41988.1 type II toxin-antitoxin system HipA family toxin [Rhizorhabdus dicambivorans]